MRKFAYRVTKIFHRRLRHIKPEVRDWLPRTERLGGGAWPPLAAGGTPGTIWKAHVSVRPPDGIHGVTTLPAVKNDRISYTLLGILTTMVKKLSDLLMFSEPGKLVLSYFYLL